MFAIFRVFFFLFCIKKEDEKNIIITIISVCVHRFNQRQISSDVVIIMVYGSHHSSSHISPLRSIFMLKMQIIHYLRVFGICV